MRVFVLFFALLSANAFAVAPPTQHYALGPVDARLSLRPQGVDRAAALAEDALKPKSARLRYALRRDFSGVSATTSGEWLDVPDGMLVWRLPVHADNALSLDLGFRDFFLPPGARLFVGNETQQLRPFDDSDNPRNARFFTPLVHGDHVQIEVLLPRAMKRYLRLDLASVNVGYRDIFHRKSFADPTQGSGTCNIDTICSQGDPWRSEINAEAVVAVSSGFCSGQLLNDTKGDHAPLLSTANHCVASQDDADSLVVYWKYESPTCRVVGSAANGDPVPVEDSIAQTGGSTLLATYQPADFTLVRLNTAPPAAAQAYWNGWDRTLNVFSGGSVMHHPNSDAKRISFPAGTVTLDDNDYGQDNIPGVHHWRVDHYAQGTTEEGSSGSGLLDASHHLRGVLSGGAALCSVPNGDDYYGRLSEAWLGDGTSSGRMRDWLDPVGTQPQSLNGTVGCTPPSVALSSSASVATAGEHVTFAASVSGGSAPYTFAFDVDGDGIADNLDPTAASVVTAYPTAFSGNVEVKVTDAGGCTGSTSRAQIVQAQDMTYDPSANGIGGYEGPATVALVCGSNTAAAQPGQRFQAVVFLHNQGSAAPSNGYAVFAQDLSDSNAAKITLETPAIAIAPDSDRVALSFATSPNAACGSHIAIDYLGVADDNGFTPAKSRVVDMSIASNCQAQACVAQTTPFAFHQGNYYDPKRPGNGITAEVAHLPNSDPLFFGAWFTGDGARDPTWYVFSNLIEGNQANGTLYQPHLTAPTAFPATNAPVGAAQATYVAANKIVYTWTLGVASGGGVLVPVVDDPNSTLRAWYDPNESGWGTFDELFPSVGSGGLPFMFSLAYVYDATGTPRWVQSADASYRDGNSLIGFVVRPSCPVCVWLDNTIGVQQVGSQRYQISGSNGTISTGFVLLSSYPGTWTRNNVPITSLIAQ